MAAGLPDHFAPGVHLVDYIYEQPPEADFRGAGSPLSSSRNFPCAAGIGHGGACRAHDGHGFRHQQCADLIDKLTLEMNKIRQAGITKELIEIVSGAASAVL
jgi:F-type H+-transporting ATPase subunit gamma